MTFPIKIAATGLTLTLLAACSQQEEPMVVAAETPIYAKDGTIIGMRPTVSPGGGSGMGSSMDDMDDMDDDDDDG